MESHFSKLERMCLSAKISDELYKVITIHISPHKAEQILQAEEKFFHAANAVHGYVYFKMLDDTAFFAVSSAVQHVLYIPYHLIFSFCGLYLQD